MYLKNRNFYFKMHFALFKNLKMYIGFKKLLFSLFLILGALNIFVFVYASSTSTFNQIINPGILSVDVVDASYATVTTPSVSMSAVTFDFGCQAATGTFGTATQQIYIKNPDAADSGWTVSLAASAPTISWNSAAGYFDFNDSTGSGCTDGGGDADSLGGQMTVNASVGTLAIGQCSSCVATNITKGSSSAFNEGVVDSITILDAASGSSDIGDWKLAGVSVGQQIPKEQPASSYAIDLTLSIIAK
jgi:hypothetical protein